MGSTPDRSHMDREGDSLGRVDRHLLACGAMALTTLTGATLGGAVVSESASADIFVDTTYDYGSAFGTYILLFDMGTKGKPTAKTVGSYGPLAGVFGGAPGYEFAMVVKFGYHYLIDNPYDTFVFSTGAVYKTATSSYVSLLGGGVSVAASSFVTAPGMKHVTYTKYGYFKAFTAGQYLGFSVAKGASTYYGWMSNYVLGVPTAKVTWGWESTAGTDILTGAVPEPGAGALGLLALGALGIQRWRRREDEPAQ